MPSQQVTYSSLQLDTVQLKIRLAEFHRLDLSSALGRFWVVLDAPLRDLQVVLDVLYSAPLEPASQILLTML